MSFPTPSDNVSFIYSSGIASGLSTIALPTGAGANTGLGEPWPASTYITIHMQNPPDGDPKNDPLMERLTSVSITGDIITLATPTVNNHVGPTVLAIYTRAKFFTDLQDAVTTLQQQVTTFQLPTPTPNGTVTIFTFPKAPPSHALIFVDGQANDVAQYAVTGNQITLDFAPTGLFGLW